MEGERNEKTCGKVVTLVTLYENGDSLGNSLSFIVVKADAIRKTIKTDRRERRRWSGRQICRVRLARVYHGILTHMTAYAVTRDRSRFDIRPASAFSTSQGVLEEGDDRFVFKNGDCS